MKKVTCIVLYRYINKRYKLISITIKHKHSNAPLFDGLNDDYELFNDMYKDVLAILKANNFYVHKWNIYNSTWHDIDFIDLDYFSVDRYALK